MQFSSEVLKAAFTAPNGELAWKKPEVFAALDELAAAGQAVYHGEAWIIGADGSIALSLPAANGTEGFYAWLCKQQEGEPWNAYVARSKTEAIEMVNKLETTDFVNSETLGSAHFNLNYSDKE